MVGAGDPLRSRGRIYLDRLRHQVGHHFSVARRRKRHSDVVSEEPAPTIGDVGQFLGEFAPQQRPLKPVRMERKKVPLQDGQDVRILLSVVRAYDVPVRSEQDPVAQQQQQQALRTSSVSSLQGAAAASSSSGGGAPPRLGSSDAMRDALPSEALVRSYVEARFQVYD